MAFLGPYYYGKRRFDKYARDIEGAIESGNTTQRESIALQSNALDVAHQQLVELHEQTEQFRHIERTLENGFEELRAEFHWGFTSMVDRMDMQITLLSNVAAELAAIHQTLQSPLINQAQELFRLGEEHYNENLFDRALEKFLESERKNEVHPLLQFRIGMLYLYPHGDGDDLIDMPHAETHFLLAARYADAKKKTLSRWNELCGQAYFHAAVGAYLIGEQEQAAGRADSMRACLGRALGYLAKAVTIWPQFTEIVYHQAKCHALLGQVQDAQEKLEILADRDRRYSAKALQDGDFHIFRTSIEEIFRRAINSPGPLARATHAQLEKVEAALAWAKRSAPSTEDAVAVESIEKELGRARQSLPTLDVDIEGLSERLNRMRSELEKIAQRSFQNNIKVSQETIASFEERKKGYEDSIDQLKHTMKATGGARSGWVVFFVLVFLFYFGTAAVLRSLEMSPQEMDRLGMIIFMCGMLAAVAGAVIVSWISRESKNRPHKLKIEECSRAMEECTRTLPSLGERTNSWKGEMQRFSSWKAERLPTLAKSNENLMGAKNDPVSVPVKSPFAGTYYESPAPGAVPFVRLGDQVRSGQVLCIIKCMQIRSEIEAEAAGVITAKLIENGQKIKYGEKLFELRTGDGHLSDG
jgi:biotin carboxyl carrier protein